MGEGDSSAPRTACTTTRIVVAAGRIFIVGPNALLPFPTPSASGPPLSLFVRVCDSESRWWASGHRGDPNFPLTAFPEVRRARVPSMARGWVAWDTATFAPHYRGRDTQEEAGSVEKKGEARMSEGSGSARAEMERRLVEKSLENEAFRWRLIEDPKGAVEQELGTRLPEEVRVVTVEETAESIYLVLPGTPMAGAESVELSDRELESVT